MSRVRHSLRLTQLGETEREAMRAKHCIEDEVKAHANCECLSYPAAVCHEPNFLSNYGVASYRRFSRSSAHGWAAGKHTMISMGAPLLSAADVLATSVVGVGLTAARTRMRMFAHASTSLVE